VFNGNASLFIVTNGLPPGDPNFKSGSANFIFDTENGTISGRSNAVAASQSFIAVDNSGSGAVYKGLAIATTANGTFLYAANFQQWQDRRLRQQFQAGGRLQLRRSATAADGPPGSGGLGAVQRVQ
jgi:hypothetical protein